jgi:AraC-like DNA-binding protein
MSTNNAYTIYVINAIAFIKQQIEDNPLAYRTCKELLERLTTVNRKLLERSFKDLHGYRIKEYHVKHRLGASRQYLKEGMPMKQVAAKCFYKSQSAFSTAFKKEFGCSPKDWLKIVSKETAPSIETNK